MERRTIRNNPWRQFIGIRDKDGHRLAAIYQTEDRRLKFLLDLPGGHHGITLSRLLAGTKPAECYWVDTSHFRLEDRTKLRALADRLGYTYR